MVQINPADFNQKAQFGKVKTVKNDFTGATSKEFVKKLELWFASKTRTLSQQYQLQGTQLENSRTIIIRHNANVEKLTIVKIGDTQYEIDSYSPDETSNIIRYDYLTLKRST